MMLDWLVFAVGCLFVCLLWDVVLRFGFWGLFVGGLVYGWCFCLFVTGLVVLLVWVGWVCLLFFLRCGSFDLFWGLIGCFV